jgi:mono/diheme cytochrome c family protein
MKILMMVLAISQPAYADISGEALFKTYCASCHGSNGEGSAIANFKLSERLVKSDEELSKSIREGKGKLA